MSRKRQDGPADVLFTRTQGRAPVSTKLRASWAPMKPPPPVIRTWSRLAMVLPRCERLD